MYCIELLTRLAVVYSTSAYRRSVVVKLNKGKIEAKGLSIQIYTEDFEHDYISLTDIARYKNVLEPKDVVKNWLRVRDTIEFLGLWETINNPNFKGVEFDSFRKESGTNAFTLSPQRWISSTNAIGIVSKSGRGGGTFAHPDIAMEFASWISAEFKLYLIQDYKRLKKDENSRLSLSWNLNREISKINYKIHTNAIKEHLLKNFTKEQLSYKYASEADMLNVALFNKRAKQWREANPELKGNMRDYASLNELLVLANMESYNLFDEQAILANKALARELGLNEALVMQQINYWIEINKRSGKNYHDGKYWTYNSIRAWQENDFDYMSVDTVKRTFTKLAKAGYLLVGNYNKDPRDKTKWYTINNDKLEELNILEIRMS